MFYIAAVMRIFYYMVAVNYYRRLFPPKHSRWLPILLTGLLIIAVHFLSIKGVIHVTSLPIITVLIAAALWFSTGMNRMQAVHTGIMCVLYTCYVSSIAAILSTIFVHSHIPWTEDQIRPFSFPAALLFFLLLRRFLLFDEKLKLFLQNIEQFKFITVLQVFAAFNLLIVHFVRLNLSTIWSLTLALSTSALTIAALVYTVLYYARSAEYLEAKWIQKMLEEQFDRQLRHYDFYQKHTDSFRTFIHDYKALMTSLKALINANENEKAMQLIRNIDNDMYKKMHLHKKYTTNVVLDAVLQDVANICDANGIRYSFHFLSSHHPRLPQLSHLRIFNNIVNNAIEACMKVPKSERFLEIGNQNHKQWITLEARNSYIGNITLDKGKPVSTKQDKSIHGLGLQSVHEIAEELGGFVVYDIDEEQCIFLIRIHLPKV